MFIFGETDQEKMRLSWNYHVGKSCIKHLHKYAAACFEMTNCNISIIDRPVCFPRPGADIIKNRKQPKRSYDYGSLCL